MAERSGGELTTVVGRAAVVVRRLDTRIERRTRKLVTALAQGARDASQIGDNDPVPPDWSPTRYRIAQDMRRPQKLQPGYIGFALKLWLSYQESARPAPAPLNVAVVHVDRATFSYPVRDVSDPE